MEFIQFLIRFSKCGACLYQLSHENLKLTNNDVKTTEPIIITKKRMELYNNYWYSAKKFKIENIAACLSSFFNWIFIERKIA